MKVLVTGAAGFIGSNLVRELLYRGHEVIAIDDLSAGHMSNLHGVDCEFHKKDITKADKWGKLFKGVDVVLHQAAAKKNVCSRDPMRDMDVNGKGALKLLHNCVKYGVKKFVHASTGSVYGEQKTIITEESPLEPVSYYGVSKLAGERYVQMFHNTFGLNTSILRYFHVYGQRQDAHPKYGGVIAIFSERIKKGMPIVIHGTGLQQRIFTYVDDVVRANIMCMHDNRTNGEVYNVCGDYQVILRDVADEIEKYLRKKVYHIRGARLLGDIDKFEVDNSKIKKLGMYFTPFKEGLHAYLDILR